jgi:hypothetical protein
MRAGEHISSRVTTGTSGNWLQQGKLNRLSQTATFDSTAGIVAARSTASTPVVKTPNVTPAPSPASFTGAYVEFLPNGSTTLDPSATPGNDSDSGWLCPRRRPLTHAGSQKPSFAFGADDRSADRKRRSKMNRLDHTRASDQGFSLIEVVLAIGIVSFAVLSIFGLLPVATDTNKRARDEHSAAQLVITNSNESAL